MVNQFTKYSFFLLILIGIINNANSQTKDQEIKIMLRDIGDEFLFQIVDSTSRILPIEKIEGRYVVNFERSFAFEPDMLFFSTYKVLEESNSKDHFIVEVESCNNKELVHSFRASLTEDFEKIACKQRALPIGCYTFYFTYVVNKEQAQFNVESNKSKYSKGLVWWSLISVLFFIIIIWFLYNGKKNQAIKVKTNVIVLGKYCFDPKRLVLLYKAETIELSSKESELLFLFVSNENKTLKREFILKEVWQDEGNYIGRTLDVFISKLRKKLEEDPTLKIINVRGVGYRFVMS